MDSADLGGPEPKGMDADERREMVVDRRQMLKRAGLGAAALTIPAAVMATPAMGSVADALAADSFIKSHPKWKFVFVNHVTTNPFFVPTHLRSAGRVLAARLQLPVDGLADVRHQPDGQRVQRGDHGQGGRHRGLPRRSLKAFNGPTEPRACGKGIPVAQLQRRRATGNNAARLHRPGSLPVRLQHGPADRRRSSRAATWRSSSPRRASSTSSRASTARMAAIKKFGKGKIKTTSTATGAAPPRRAGEDRGLLPRSQEPEGHVRRRRRLDAGRRPGHAEVRPRRRRASRPAATTSGRPP